MQDPLTPPRAPSPRAASAAPLAALLVALLLAPVPSAAIVPDADPITPAAAPVVPASVTVPVTAPAIPAQAIAVQEIVRAALARDPAVARAEAALAAAQGRERAAAGLRANPTLEARVSTDGGAEIGLGQPLSLSGEGRAAREVARLEVEAAQAALSRQRLETAAAARALLVEAVHGAQAEALARESLALARQLRALADRRLAAGEGTGLEVQLSRLEETAAAAALLAAGQIAAQHRADLLALTGLGAGIALPADPMSALPAPADPTGTDRLSALLTHRLRLDAAEAAAVGAQAAILPPVELRLWAERQGDGWAVGPGIAVTLPVWKANPAEHAEAAAEVSAAASDVAAAESARAAQQAGAAERRALLEAVGSLEDPASVAREALLAVQQAVDAGELDMVSAVVLRAHVLSVWQTGAEARALIARIWIGIALEEEWPTLL